MAWRCTVTGAKNCPALGVYKGIPSGLFFCLKLILHPTNFEVLSSFGPQVSYTVLSAPFSFHPHKYSVLLSSLLCAKGCDLG